MQGFYVRVQQTLTGPPLLLSAVSAGSAALTSSMESHFFCFHVIVFRLAIFSFYKRKFAICIDIIYGTDFARGGHFKVIRNIFTFYKGHHY